jgi:hypothetical protein
LTFCILFCLLNSLSLSADRSKPPTFRFASSLFQTPDFLTSYIWKRDFSWKLRKFLTFFIQLNADKT